MCYKTEFQLWKRNDSIEYQDPITQSKQLDLCHLQGAPFTLFRILISPEQD